MAPSSNIIRFFFHLFFFLAFFAAAAPAHAGGLVTIRDTEIEGMLKTWTAPLIRAAGLGQDAVKIILVQSPDVNAFVAGGPNIFIYTGLLEKTDSPAEVMGVVAHELGHIEGGHLVRAQEQMENASYEVILGTILGVGVAAASGSADAAAAISTGAAHLAQRNFLSFSRTQESSADQAAVRILGTAHEPMGGLVSFMQKLADEETMPTGGLSAYTRTHPLSRDRVEALRAAVGDKASGMVPAAWIAQHARMKAKLIAYIAPAQVQWLYPESEGSIPARYARVVAAYRQNQVETALSGVDALIKDEPQNPYFYELKGQMLYEFGRTAPAAEAYAQAASLAPDAPLIRIAYAQALIADPHSSPAQAKKAIDLLNAARVDEPRYSLIYRLLATLYGRAGQDGAAQAMLAEEAMLAGRTEDARRMAQRAIDILPPDEARLRQRARDLLALLDQQEAKKKRKNK